MIVVVIGFCSLEQSVQAQVCSGTPNSGLWSDSHSFPRLAAINAAYSTEDQTLGNYNALAAFDVVLSGSYLADWTGSSRLPTVNYAQYLHQKNPRIKLVPYFHAYALKDPSLLGAEETFPDMYAVSRAVQTANGAGGNGWWLVDDQNQPVSPWANFSQSWLRNQFLINWSFQDPTNRSMSFPTWMTQYVNSHILNKTYGANVPYWDGFWMEADTNTPHQLAGTAWDLDENHQLDNFEQTPRKGKVWMVNEQTAGWNYLYAQLRSDALPRKIATGGELWSPGVNGVESTPISWSAVNFASLIFLESPYFDPSCGGDENRYWSGSSCITEPPGGTARLWDFHMAQTVKFVSRNQENLMLFKPSDIEYIQSDNYLARFFAGSTAQAKYSRFLLGSAFLVNAYAQPAPGDGLPAKWCDECGVDANGAATQQPVVANKSWMGCPLGEAKPVGGTNTFAQMVAQNRWKLSDFVWQREFANALLLVNPTATTKTVQLPSSGWRKIRGVADPSYNDGSATGQSVTIPAMDALFLVRDTAPTGIPDPSCTVDPDINNDQSVNILDLTFVVSHFGTTGSSPYDVTCDQVVDIRDFTKIISSMSF